MIDPDVERAMERVEAALAKATPGPWEKEDGSWIVWKSRANGEDVGEVYTSEDDAALIVAAVNHLPAILAFARSKAGEVEEQRRLATLRAEGGYELALRATTAEAQLASAQAEIERLHEALGWFLADERFQVAVGGNPNVVDRMLMEARAALAQSTKEKSK